MRAVSVALLVATVALTACSSGGNHTNDAAPDALFMDAGAPDAPDAPPDDAGIEASRVDLGVGDQSIADAAGDAVDGASDAADASDPGPEIPTAVQVPRAGAPTVAGGWRATCVASTDSTQFTPDCWVIRWHQWTYWAMSNADNRYALYIVAVDAAGNPKPEGNEKAGTRYVWLASVDETARTVTFHGQSGADITISWDELAAGAPLTPHVAQAPATAGPTVGDWLVSCLVPGGGTTQSSVCPVVKWGRWTYWALSNRDNRTALYIVGVDENGVANPSGGIEKPGARYVVNAAIDDVAKAVIFDGQGGDQVTATFDELRIDQH